MKKIYFFNPEHDMALANFSCFYKAPAEIIRMADDLSVLPAWYADEEAVIKVDSLSRVEALSCEDLPDEWLSRVEWTTKFLSYPYEVWGWNPALLHRLREAGVNENVLLSDEAMKRIQILSGRQCCRDVLKMLSDFDFVCGESYVCTTLEEVKKYFSVWDKVVLKAPWSGSGRGLLMIDSMHWNRSAEGWVSRILRTQKAVIAEPYYRRQLDFAMEFFCDEKNSVKFIGYSLFETDTRGSYKGNLLASDRQIEQILSHYISIDKLHAVRERLMMLLPALFAGNYCGYFGVDMMVCEEENTFLLHPCVEINLRMNMGVVAHVLTERYLYPGSQGQFSIEYYNADGDALKFHSEMKRLFPLQLDGRFIKNGYLSLTPVCENTRYQAFVLTGGRMNENLLCDILHKTQ